MTFRLYLYFMGLASTTAWVAWIIVIHAIDPVQTNTLGLILFYMTLAIALIGSFSLLGAGIRSWREPEKHPSRHTLTSFRQGILIASLVIVTLMMISADVLRWWSLALSVFVVSMLELTFLSFTRRS
jgi:hypothetical protein